MQPFGDFWSAVNSLAPARDDSGILQIVAREDQLTHVSKESSIHVVGILKKRDPDLVNPKILTGEFEVHASSIEVLGKCDLLPFEVDDSRNVKEELRLKYRFLDLRRESLKNNLILRHKVTMITRNYLSENGFIEVETPILCVPTPEGARDYLVPSRIYNGHFYALPQSPQIFKQLLMIGGMEKYFQIARCFRDEDLRADRQPEFTQIDIEQSFSSEEDIWATTEGLMKRIFKEIKGVDLDKFVRIPYEECMDRFEKKV